MMCGKLWIPSSRSAKAPDETELVLAASAVKYAFKPCHNTGRRVALTNLGWITAKCQHLIKQTWGWGRPMSVQGFPIPAGDHGDTTQWLKWLWSPGQSEGNWVLLMKVWAPCPCSCSSLQSRSCEMEPTLIFSPSVVGLLSHWHWSSSVWIWRNFQHLVL